MKRKLAITAVVLLVLVLICFAVLASAVNDPPRFTFLEGLQPVISRADYHGRGGKVGWYKVKVYRVRSDYRTLLQNGRKELDKEGNWKPSGNGKDPFLWQEFQGDNEGVEFIDGSPTRFDIDDRGVLWTPDKKERIPGEQTVFLTQRADWMEATAYSLKAKVRNLFGRKPTPPPP